MYAVGHLPAPIQEGPQHFGEKRADACANGVSAPRSVDQVDYFDIEDAESDTETTCSDIEHHTTGSCGSERSSLLNLSMSSALTLGERDVSSEHDQCGEVANLQAAAATPPSAIFDHAPSHSLAPVGAVEHPDLATALPRLTNSLPRHPRTYSIASDGSGAGTPCGECDLAKMPFTPLLNSKGLKHSTGEGNATLDSVWLGLQTVDLFMETMGSLVKRVARPLAGT